MQYIIALRKDKGCGRVINTIGFIINTSKANAISHFDEVINMAVSKGFQCVMEEDMTNDSVAGCKTFADASPDMLVVLGGDGTILRAAARAVELDIPVCGVNLGRKGFLSEFTIDEFPNALDFILNNKFTIDHRMMLECSVNGNPPWLCINDVLLYKKSYSGVVDINVNIDGVDAGTVFCDGLVVSTPTGSTGYSISAGGPVIAPGIDASIITPVCPHALSFRPIITSPDSLIRLVTNSPALLALDGISKMRISTSDELLVTGAKQRIGFMRFSKRNLYSLIRSKLS